MTTNGTGNDGDLETQAAKAEHCIEALNRAVDGVTDNILEKLASVRTRVDNLEAAIKAQSEQTKRDHAMMVQLVSEADREADVQHKKLDDVECVLPQPSLNPS
jgi:uncharacterized protein (DUF3084 family)